MKTWTADALRALHLLQQKHELTSDAVDRIRRLAEEDAETDVVHPINVGFGAAHAGYESIANLGLGDGYEPSV